MRQYTEEAIRPYAHVCCDVCASVCIYEDCNPDVNCHDHDQLLDSVPSQFLWTLSSGTFKHYNCIQVYSEGKRFPREPQGCPAGISSPLRGTTYTYTQSLALAHAHTIYCTHTCMSYGARTRTRTFCGRTIRNHSTFEVHWYFDVVAIKRSVLERIATALILRCRSYKTERSRTLSHCCTPIQDVSEKYSSASVVRFTEDQQISVVLVKRLASLCFSVVYSEVERQKKEYEGTILALPSQRK